MGVPASGEGTCISYSWLYPYIQVAVTLVALNVRKGLSTNNDNLLPTVTGDGTHPEYRCFFSGHKIPSEVTNASDRKYPTQHTSFIEKSMTLKPGQHFFSTLKHFFSTLTFFFNPATFLFHPRTLFFDPVTFFFNPCTCFFDPGPFFFNPVHLGPPDFPAARSASFTLDGSSSSRLPAYKLWAVGGPIWGLQWSGWVLEAT